jgi:hypothetical protein
MIQDTKISAPPTQKLLQEINISVSGKVIASIKKDLTTPFCDCNSFKETNISDPGPATPSKDKYIKLSTNTLTHHVNPKTVQLQSKRPSASARANALIQCKNRSARSKELLQSTNPSLAFG